MNSKTDERCIKFSAKSRKSPADYYLGLDIGTGSVGYAVTDLNYKLCKKSGKSLWGVRLFNTANTAEERRVFRTARRRRKREKMRLKLLQEFFAPGISAVDPGFYQRLKDSFFHVEDKLEPQYNSLFNDPEFSDKEYYAKYPTIYHLRSTLMHDPEPHDVRLVYLACHHIMKHRGHFLFDGESINVGNQFEESWREFLNQIRNYQFDTDEDEDDELIDQSLFSQSWHALLPSEIKAILLDDKALSSFKIREITNRIPGASKADKELCKLLVGNSTKLSTLFNDEELDECDPAKVELGENFEANRTALEDILGERLNLIECANNIFSAITLENILGSGDDGKTYSELSSARIAIYEKHGADLKRLKSLLHRLDSENNTRLYSSMFRQDDKTLANYPSYSGHVSGDADQSVEKRCNVKSFHEYIQKILKPYEEDTEVAEILSECARGTFLPKISSSANGVVPRQLHQAELQSILHNASAYLPFLDEETVCKIIQLFAFRIPYYVGPFDNRSKFAWLVRKTNEPIRPWNIENVVDLEKSAEKFIRNLTNKCTYLIGEDVLPAKSILYSEYLVRQAINILTVDGQRLDRKYREYLYDTLFLNRSKGGKITKKRIASALKAAGYEGTISVIGGMDEEIPANISWKKDFGPEICAKLTAAELEEIITRLTVFPGDRTLITEWLLRNYGDRLNPEEITAISKIKYDGWGALSRKLLSGIKHPHTDGRSLSIIEIMREEPLILIEILYKYSFKEQIEKINEPYQDLSNALYFESLDDYRLSPPVRKSVWQAFRVYEEITRIMGAPPSKIFVEVAREVKADGKKKKTDSRKTQLLELYKNCTIDSRNWTEEINALDEKRFKAKKLYLYYLQAGRCMYTGTQINLSDLWNDNLYDIDHIYPRSLTKDDSWHNLVLVTSESNRSKSDNYPLTTDVQSLNHSHWSYLREKGLISEEKYKRLTRVTPLTDTDLSGFISRQLVETQQSTKVVAELLKRFAPQSDIVYVKAALVSDFRYNDGSKTGAQTRFFFPKIRELNDLHHAKDAYLNIVVGNVYNTEFAKFANWKAPQNNYREMHYNLTKLFDRPVKSKSTVAWVPGDEGSIAVVNKMMLRNDVLFSYETCRVGGKLFNATILKKGQKPGPGQMPVKPSIKQLVNRERYGILGDMKNSHLCLISHKKSKRTLVFLPITLAKDGFKRDSILEYLRQEGYVNPVILCEEIKINSIIVKNNVRFRVLAKTGEKVKCANTTQLLLPENMITILRGVNNTVSKEVDDPALESINLSDLYDYLVERLQDSAFIGYSAISSQYEKLKKVRDAFTELGNIDQAKQLLNVINLFNNSGRLSNLSILYTENGNSSSGGQTGMISINRKLSDNDQFSILDVSVTGFYQKETKY